MATAQMPEKTSPTSQPPANELRKSRLKLFFLKALVAFVGLVALLCVIIATRPDDFKVTRTATMAAPPEAVFAQVNDFHNWEAWSPWAELDPNAKNTYEGPASGKGSKFSWAGNSSVGEGNMTIVESKPNELVGIRLEFIKPFAGTNDVQLKIEPQGDQTSLTWSMSGKNNFIGKAIGLVMDCEKMVGDQFDQGMANIKAIVEKKSS